MSPDVSSSTNLGGWVNKVGVWSADERRDWFADDAETILHWRERPTGQHIELGIAETNLVGLLGELGATWSRWGEPLLPIGVLYDPFVERALEPWSFGIYAGGQSILVGTPSGVTLAAGGRRAPVDHDPVDRAGAARLHDLRAGVRHRRRVDACSPRWPGWAGPDGSSAYLRLSTRPVDQTLAAVPADPAARERRRRQVVAGAYPLRRAPDGPTVTIAAMGAMVPEALAAADRLAEHRASPADVVCVTSPGLLFRALQARAGPRGRRRAWILDQAFPAERAAPMVTVLDGHPHTLAFLAAINRVPARRLGVLAVRPVRATRGRVPLPRHRHRQHRPRRPRPSAIAPNPRPCSRFSGIPSATLVTVIPPTMPSYQRGEN